MEWKVISILAAICQLTATVHGGSVGGPSLTYREMKRTHRASVVLCHPEQTFFCVNQTHYSPCVHLDLSTLSKSTDTVSLGDEFYCGSDRCCQAGATSPCTYRCQRQSLDLGNAHIPWNFHRSAKKKTKRSKEPFSSGEVDRLNKIVSIKSFIIRQKDLEGWDDYDDDDDGDNTFKWKPSYRTFCPLRKSSADKPCESSFSTTGAGTTITTTSLITTTTLKPTTESTVATVGITTSQTTTTAAPTTTTRTTTTTTTRTTTTSATTTTTRTTTRRTTTKQTTTRPTTTKRRTARRTTTKRRTTTNRRPTKRTTPPRRFKEPAIPCTNAIVQRKVTIPGTCQDYLICKRTDRNKFAWEIKSCPRNEYFSPTWQLCQKMELVPCVINRDRLRKRKEQTVFRE